MCSKQKRQKITALHERVHLLAIRVNNDTKSKELTRIGYLVSILSGEDKRLMALRFLENSVDCLL